MIAKHSSGWRSRLDSKSGIEIWEVVLTVVTASWMHYWGENQSGCEITPKPSIQDTGPDPVKSQSECLPSKALKGLGDRSVAHIYRSVTAVVVCCYEVGPKRQLNSKAILWAERTLMDVVCEAV